MDMDTEKGIVGVLNFDVECVRPRTASSVGVRGGRRAFTASSSFSKKRFSCSNFDCVFELWHSLRRVRILCLRRALARVDSFSNSDTSLKSSMCAESSSSAALMSASDPPYPPTRSVWTDAGDETDDIPGDATRSASILNSSGLIDLLVLRPGGPLPHVVHVLPSCRRKGGVGGELATATFANSTKSKRTAIRALDASGLVSSRPVRVCVLLVPPLFVSRGGWVACGTGVASGLSNSNEFSSETEASFAMAAIAAATPAQSSTSNRERRRTLTRRNPFCRVSGDSKGYDVIPGDFAP